MKTRTKILNKAGVLLIAAFMVLSILPAVTADTSDFADAKSQGDFSANGMPSIPQKPVLFNVAKLDIGEGFGDSFALGSDEWYYLHNGASHDPSLSSDSISLTAAGTMYCGITLDFTGEVGNEITKVSYLDYGDGTGAGLDLTVKIYEGSLGGSPTEVYSEDFPGFTTDSGGFEDITLATPVEITQAQMSIGFIVVQTAASQFVFSVDLGPMDPNGGWISTTGTFPYDTLAGFGFDYNWLMEAYVAGGGGPGPEPGEDCIEDACDFAIAGFTDEFLAMSVPIDFNGDGEVDYYAWNSNPHEICIRIANKGDIGIGELKLLADVFEKICGPTIIIFDDPKYDIQQFPCCGSDYPFEFPDSGYTPIGDEPLDPWTVSDDDDHDSWALQGGPENRWLTNNQAWRCTKGEDRSFGVDEDVYLGKSDTSPALKHDNLTTPAFDLSGAACATFSFSHWCEGEYTTNEDGDIIPADYGTIAYSLDDGATWSQIPISKFLAYDNDWQDVTIKFINTEIDADDADYMHPYNMVCDDCEPDQDDIVIMDNLTNAILKVKFIWHKDPCLQYEGWYVDNVQLDVTEDYELELVCQTHEIIEMEPCDAEVGVVWEDYCFPLPCEFEDDTWYEVHIFGQVFDPNGCEFDLENNEFKFQFKIMDLHDVKCVSMEATSPTDVLPGESVSVNVTVKNVGTYAEEDIPVSLQMGSIIVDQFLNDHFETDSLGDYSIYYFNFDAGPSKIPWHWSKGESFLSNIYTDDACQARSRNPGSECLVGTESSYSMQEDTLSVIAAGSIDLDPNNNWKETGENDCDDPCDAEMSFEAKWSLEAGGMRADYALMPAEGPGSGYVFWFTIPEIVSDADGYENDWVSFDLSYSDLVGMFEDIMNYFPEYDGLPECEVGLSIAADGMIITDWNPSFMPGTPNGGCTNPLNPVPWTGFLFDNWYIEVNSLGDTDEVASIIIPELAQNEEKTVQMAWTAELCKHGLEAETQLPGDMNHANDRCCMVTVTATQEERCFDSYIEDMTGGGPCLWHACTNRENGDDYFAWAGEETEHSGLYVNNMDQGLVSPTIDLSYSDFELFAVNFSTWYEFSDTDFGEVDIWKTYDHDADPETANLTKWVQIGKVSGTTHGAFETESFIVDPTTMENERTKIRFRMYSNDEGVANGWYVDDVRIVNCTSTGSFADAWYPSYNDGYTDNALRWTDFSPWTEANELSGSELAPYMGYDITEILLSCGCDQYGFYAEDYEVYCADGSLPDMTTIGDDETLVASGTASSTGWTSIVTAPYTITTDPTYVIVQWLGGYAGFPAGFDTDNNDLRGQNMLDHGSTTLWTTLGALGYPAVWGLNVGLTAGGISGVTYLEDMPVLTWMDDQDDIDGYPSDLVELPDYPYVNMEGIGSDHPTWDTFERGVLAPWTCEPSEGGQYWMNWVDLTDNSTLPNDASDYYFDMTGECDPGWYTIPSEKLVPWGYNAEGTGMNDAIAFELDLTGETLNQQYIKFCCAMDYDFKEEKAYIEFSPDWEPGTPMESATWTVYWCHTPGDSYGDNTGGWIDLDDFTSFDDDDRWVIEEYAGETVYVRFRLETEGNGAAIGEGWALDDVHLEVKHTGEAFVDNTAPQTSIYFDEVTAKVTLIAQDFPIGKSVGVKATYYKIDGGAQQSGIEFTLDEGTHTVEYWSVDNNDNEESHKTATFTVDTTAPTIEITSPVEGKLYILGNPVMDRIIGSKTLCIGQVPIAADATDEGSGVRLVIFTLSNGDSGVDNDGAPYDYTFRGMHFGDLTISAVAMDNNGLTSSADEITITCYSLGLL